MDEMIMVRRPASLVDWSAAPVWMAVDHAAFLVGMAVEVVLDWIDQGAVEAAESASGETLIERSSLREFWEIVHGGDGLFDDA